MHASINLKSEILDEDEKKKIMLKTSQKILIKILI